MDLRLVYFVYYKQIIDELNESQENWAKVTYEPRELEKQPQGWFLWEDL